MVKLSIVLLLGFALFCIIIKQQEPAFQKLNSYKDFPISSAKGPDTLVLFDVDKTLITLPDRMYFPLLFRLRILWHFPQLIYSQAWDEMYGHLWQQSKFILIESYAAKLINILKSQGCIVLGLTSMVSGGYGVISSMPEWRFNILHTFGIEFTQKFADHIFTDFPTYRGSYPLLYRGILYANHQPKGLVLEAFLKQFKLQPQKIISFDDHIKPLQSIYDACNRLNIPVVLYQYTGAERFKDWDNNRMLNKIKCIMEEQKLTNSAELKLKSYNQ